VAGEQGRAGGAAARSASATGGARSAGGARAWPAGGRLQEAAKGSNLAACEQRPLRANAPASKQKTQTSSLNGTSHGGRLPGATDSPRGEGMYRHGAGQVKTGQNAAGQRGTPARYQLPAEAVPRRLVRASNVSLIWVLARFSFRAAFSMRTANRRPRLRAWFLSDQMPISRCNSLSSRLLAGREGIGWSRQLNSHSATFRPNGRARRVARSRYTACTLRTRAAHPVETASLENAPLVWVLRLSNTRRHFAQFGANVHSDSKLGGTFDYRPVFIGSARETGRRLAETREPARRTCNAGVPLRSTRNRHAGRCSLRGRIGHPASP